MFTPEQIAAAKSVRAEILKSGSNDDAAKYMAGEICMWLEMTRLDFPSQKKEVCSYCDDELTIKESKISSYCEECWNKNIGNANI